MGKVAYNVNNIKFNVDGHRVRGYGKDTVITVEPNVDNAMLHVGAMGEFIFSQSNDKSATITLNLLQDSISILKLEELQKEERIFPVTLIDMNDDIIKSGADCMIQSLGGYTRGHEPTDVEVKILVAEWE